MPGGAHSTWDAQISGFSSNIVIYPSRHPLVEGGREKEGGQVGGARRAHPLSMVRVFSPRPKRGGGVWGKGDADGGSRRSPGRGRRRRGAAASAGADAAGAGDGRGAAKATAAVISSTAEQATSWHISFIIVTREGPHIAPRQHSPVLGLNKMHHNSHEANVYPPLELPFE
jgi:hypothetical protein